MNEVSRCAKNRMLQNRDAYMLEEGLKILPPKLQLSTPFMINNVHCFYWWFVSHPTACLSQSHDTFSSANNVNGGSISCAWTTLEIQIQEKSPSRTIAIPLAIAQEESKKTQLNCSDVIRYYSYLIFHYNTTYKKINYMPRYYTPEENDFTLWFASKLANFSHSKLKTLSTDEIEKAIKVFQKEGSVPATIPRTVIKYEIFLWVGVIVHGGTTCWIPSHVSTPLSPLITILVIIV